MGDFVVSKHQKLHFKPDDVGENGHVQYAITADEQDEGQNPEPNRCGNGGESPSQMGSASRLSSGHVEAAAGKDVRGTSIPDAALDTNKADGLQKLLQIVEEFESEGAANTRLQHHGRTHHNGDIDKGSPPKQGIEEGPPPKDDTCANDQRSGKEVSQGVEEAYSVKSMPQKDAPSPPPLESTKSFSKGAPRRSNEDKKVTDTGQGAATVEKRRSPRNISSSSIIVGPSRSNFTVPQPFSLATDRRASESSQKVHQLNGSPNITRKLGAKLHVAKSVNLEGVKYQEESLKKLTISSDPESHDEDAMSFSSTPSSSRAPKAKASRFTSASGFKFQCEARAEKRKEYYLQLQERLHAKEEEIRQLQVQAKKEREEEIKQLRRSLTYKASPMPSFYQEGPPPKAELTKIPTTRAKSPNFSRRDSTGSNRLCNIIRCGSEHCHSVSPVKHGKHEDPSEVLSRSSEHGSIVGSPLSEPVTEYNLTGGNNLQVLDGEMAVLGDEPENAEVVKVREPLTISPELMKSDEDEKAHVAQVAEYDPTTGNGEQADKLYFDTVCKPTKAATMTDTAGKPSQGIKGSNVLRRHNGVGSEMSASTMSGQKVEATAQVHPEGVENPATTGHKKQRRKALTPYFRKQSLTDAAQSTGNKDSINIDFQ